MKLTSSRILTFAGGLLALGVVLDAYGTHALQGELPPDRMSFYTTAVRYQFIHALGLLGIGLLTRINDSALLRWAAAIVLAGVLLFCASLYAMSFAAPRALGAVTATGGSALILGWALFAFAAWRSRQS
jgi:uncharacterized membrane protein YgdD (TMEM256/DUF423 family)